MRGGLFLSSCRDSGCTGGGEASGVGESLGSAEGVTGGGGSGSGVVADGKGSGVVAAGEGSMLGLGVADLDGFGWLTVAGVGLAFVEGRGATIDGSGVGDAAGTGVGAVGVENLAAQTPAATPATTPPKSKGCHSFGRGGLGCTCGAVRSFERGATAMVACWLGAGGTGIALAGVGIVSAFGNNANQSLIVAGRW